MRVGWVATATLVANSSVSERVALPLTEVAEGRGYHDSDGFQRPRDQMRREQKKRKQETRAQTANSGRQSSIVGLAANTSLRAAPLPSRDVFIARVHKDDGVVEMENFIKAKGITPRNLTLVCHEESKFNSFRLTVSVEDMVKVMDPAIWPKGVKLRRWFESKEVAGERLSL